jgi:hypothetical protein
MVKLGLAIALGLFYLALGAMMLIDPASWYEATPGVEHTGPFNAHFIIDVGLAFAASGALWLAAVLAPAHRGGLALGASLWPALHAAFHVLGWAQHGPPQGAALWSEVLGIVLVAAVSLSLAILFLRSDASS